MNINLILGILALVGAAGLLYFGYISSQSIGERVHETFTGRFTESTTWYFIFGAGAALCGVVLLATAIRS